MANKRYPKCTSESIIIKIVIFYACYIHVKALQSTKLSHHIDVPLKFCLISTQLLYDYYNYSY